MSRLSLRLRFTVLTGLTVLVAGAALIVGAYLLAAHSIATDPPPQIHVFQAEDADAAPNAARPLWGPDTSLRLEDGTVLTGHTFKARLAAMQDELIRLYRQERVERLRSLAWYGVAGVAGATVAATVVSWFLAGRQLRPLSGMTRAARGIATSPRHLGRRVDIDGAVEVRDLATAFNTMLERLDRAFDAQRRFVANASHELRTPLAINRTLIEVAVDDPGVPPATVTLGNTLLAVNSRHERLIEAMLTLATSEQELTERTPVDLADIAAHVLDEARPHARDARVQVRFEPGPAPAAGDPVLLERLVSNLVSNAIRHNHASGWLVVTTAANDGAATIEVANSGPLVPVHEAEVLFEPFRRLDVGDRRVARSGDAGFGLGLSIVRAITDAHEGEASLHARGEGGLTVRVALPRYTESTMVPGVGAAASVH
ncbi:MAG TPA: HAMP domain-containing sensor histidine kinase [Pilimelia sp.]|nr:HAMP domain-containing sensor histidine kinase [Pilimelia sp.]